MKPSRGLKSFFLKLLAILIIAAVFLGSFIWIQFFREEPEQSFANEIERFKYGSIGGEQNAGIPYWIWIVLPRIFPDYLPGSGGYKSLGVTWEEGHELPVGFTKKVIGFPRVGNNCALCHAGTYRTKPDEVPTVVPGSPTQALDARGLFHFLFSAAQDSRFNADTILAQIGQMTNLSFVDRQLYRFVLIPVMRKKLVEQAQKGAWIFEHDRPEWGPGRDDAFNLPKYFVVGLSVDETTGQCDFNSAWNLKIRNGPGLLFNWGGETPALRSVIVDSALGLGVRPGKAFENRLTELAKFLSDLPPPKYPFPIDVVRANAGSAIYTAQCAECHEPGAAKTSHVIPIDEIGTDRERLDSWTQKAADAFNEKMKRLEFNRPATIKNNGYYSPPLDGIWLRAPYLHNGSVRTLRDLLNPPDQRAQSFYRGYDVIDPVNVGFKEPPISQQQYFLLDSTKRGNGNQGHTYGTQLSDEDKENLLEYMKTL